MLQMFRRLSPWIVLVALLFAAEPLLHNHPLDSEASSAGRTACVVCAAGVGQLPTTTSVVSAPQVIEFAVATIVPSFVAVDVFSQRPSRAPPAA